jgi:hypothetical protein
MIQPRHLLSRAVACGALVGGMTVSLAAPARAQANLSGQGFGFPPGQLSTRALGTGGAVAELDPLTPLNPAGVSAFQSAVLFLQIEPEYRTVTTGAKTDKTTTARYPNVFGALPIGSHFALSIGASTLLDRTSTTLFTGTQALAGNDSVTMDTDYRIDGAMSDVRLALGWSPMGWLRFGVGAHAIVGHNLVSISQRFADTTEFSGFSQSIVLGFSGSAASAGMQLIGKKVAAGLSVRQGGPLRVSVEDTTLSRAHVPARIGASFAYTGFANSAIAVRTSYDHWSSLGNLGAPGLVGVNAWDSSIGADIAGPKIDNQTIYLRGGFRTRTLPFQAAGHDVTENSITGGLGTIFANGRVTGDVAVAHASRTADISATEKAWTLSIGISLRP